MTTKFKEFLNKAEAKFREEEPYTLETVLTIPTTLREFLIWFVSNTNHHITYDSDGERQSQYNTNRSTHDIFLLCRTYIREDITLQEVVSELMNLLKIGEVGTWFCITEGRRMWMKGRNWGNNYEGNSRFDEYGFNNTTLVEEFEREEIEINSINPILC